MLRRLLILTTGVLLLGTYGAFAQDADWSPVENAIYNERYQEAITTARPMVETNLKDPYGYYLLGTALYETENYDDAQTAFEQGIDTKGRYALNHVGIARILNRQGKGTEAQEKLDKALYYDKGKNINVKFAVAKAYLDAGKNKDAEVLLRQAQAEAPDNAVSYFMLGEYEFNREVWEFAMEQYAKAIEIDPSYIPAYTRIGEMKINEGNALKASNEAEEEEVNKKRIALYKEGLDYLNKAIGENENYAPSYRVRANLLVKVKQVPQAVRDMKKYLELQKNDLKAELEYGSFLFLAEQYEDAIKQFNAIDTTTGVKLRLLGMSHQQLGDLDKAQKYMDDYFILKKEEYRIADDYETYGRIMLDKGEFDKADENFEKVVQMKPEKASIWEDVAEEFRRQARAEERKASEFKKARGAIVQKGRELAKKREEAVASGDNALANQIVEQMAAVKAELDENAAMTEAASSGMLPLYKKEAYYRGKVLEKAAPSDPKILSYHYKNSLALYKGAGTSASDLRAADAAFTKCIDVKKDYLNPHLYRMQIASKLAKIDTTGNQYLDAATSIFEVYGAKDASSLDKRTTGILNSSSLILADYYFRLKGGENYDCEAARPYVQKVLALDPNNENAKAIDEYCKSAGK